MSKASSPPIKFVYFDLGNVLVSFDPKVACRNVAERFGVSVESAEQAVYASGLQDRFEHGQVDGETYAAELAATLQLEPSRYTTLEFLDAISDMFVPIESMAGILDELNERGVPFGLLSNTCVAHWDWIQRQHWSVTDRVFEPMILSCAVGSMKPDAAIYLAAESDAEKRAGVSPTEILFLDDREENVAAAKQRGWNAVECLGGSPARQILKDHGLIS